MDLSGSISLVIPNALAREGLGRILSDSGFDVAQSISTIDEILYPDNYHPHIIIVDYPDDTHDIEFEVKTLIKLFPSSKIVVLREEFEMDMFTRIFFAGAHGYIMKDISFQAFIAKIHLILMNEKVAPSELIDAVVVNPCLGRIDNHVTITDFALSDRERNILQRLTIGQPNKSISRDLNISEAAVKVAIQSIFRKMSVKNRTQAALMAKEYGIIDQNNGIAQKGMISLFAMICCFMEFYTYI